MNQLKLAVSLFLLGALAIFSAPQSAAAYDGEGRGVITLVEADGGARFHLSVDVGQCPAGSWLTMTTAYATPEKVKNAQSVVLAAFLAQREVRVYAFNDCQVQFLHMM
jgi:hypothetical protein